MLLHTEKLTNGYIVWPMFQKHFCASWLTMELKDKNLGLFRYLQSQVRHFI